ncbi:MAG: type II toxin-antitoxin system RelE/ParE family toxin [Alteromonadaceae bacterium]|nr:type II toxin-antitoxin system RelE/ParE family toxin [Alteromonadaceae bacterium]
MYYTIETTDTFANWFKKLKDKSVKRKILARLARVENGNFGDHKQIANNLYELRFFFGSGFRVYYTIRNGQLVLLIKGGDKSTQNKDIDKAKQLLKELESKNEN